MNRKAAFLAGEPPMPRVGMGENRGVVPNHSSLPPLRFEPIFQYRLWGGRRLEKLSRHPLPGSEPIGEAWVLSDRDDDASKVADGPMAGRTLGDLLREFPNQMLGTQAGKFERYPLLLKFLDAREMLSVQVHPSDDLPELLPSGERGKTEAWVVLESDPSSSIYAGLKPGTTPGEMKAKLENGTVEEDLSSFNPKVGDGVFIQAGTVHALGGGVVVFEVQQNSDVTFRLFDWNRVDAKTGKSRELHIEKGIKSTDFSKGPVSPIAPVLEASEPALRERMFSCEFFTCDRIRGDRAFDVGAEGVMRTIVCIDGSGALTSGGKEYPAMTGDVWVIPAEIGVAQFRPSGACTVLEIAVPD